jgi:hypothetical protein
MAYVGNAPAVAYTNTVKDTFSGDGSTVAFTMSLPSTTNNVRVVVENVIQDPTVAYSVSGTTLTFTSAPPSGTDNIYVVHLGPAVQTVQPPTELSGNFTLTGDLAQTGDYTLTGDIALTGNLTQTGDITLTGDVEATNISDGTTTLATGYVVNGSAKAWVNFDGTGTIAARDSLNLSSLTDNGTGDYTVNFSSAFGAADYVPTFGAQADQVNSTNNGNVYGQIARFTTALATASARFSWGIGGISSTFDPIVAAATIHGDLA